MSRNPLVSVGLVTWNSAKTLADCLESLQLQVYPHIELILIDNASKDSSVQILQSHFPDTPVVQNKENVGFCRAHNQAIQSSSGAYYLALNPDVIMHSKYIATMLEALETHPACGSAAGKLWQAVDPQKPSIIDSTGLFINRQRRQYLRGHGEEDSGQYDQEGEVFGVDGAAALYRRTMLEDVKVQGQYFDENFFAHKEDVDLAWRAKLMGWRCWYTPEATAIHPRSFRPGRRSRMPEVIRTQAVKNRYLLMVKNESAVSWRKDFLHILAYDIQIAIYILLFERSSLRAFPLLRQQWHEAMKWRRQILARTKVQPEEILSWFA